MCMVLNMKHPGVFQRWQQGEVVYIGREQPYNGVVIPASPLRNNNLLRGQPRGTTIEKFTRDLKDLIRAGDVESFASCSGFSARIWTWCAGASRWRVMGTWCCGRRDGWPRMPGRRSTGRWWRRLDGFL